MDLTSKRDNVIILIYSDQCKASQDFHPKLWIKWNGDERIIKMMTLLGDIVHIKEDDLRRINLKMTKIRIGRTYRKFMSYNKPYRQANRIPLLAISKNLKKKIGRLSVNVEKEYEKRKHSK